MRGVRPSLVWTIFVKELREIVRDRRTLFLLVGAPVIFYPLLLITVAEVSASQVERLEAQRVEVAVADAVPTSVVEAIRGAERVTLADSDDPLGDLRRGELDAWVDADSAEDPATTDRQLKLTIHYNSVVPASTRARDRVADRVATLSKEIVLKRLEGVGRDEAWIAPVETSDGDVAPPARRLGSLAALILPALVLVFMVTGAFYPAIDLTAGEKERKTLQTLLTSPIRPVEIVAGKYLTVFAMALISGVVNVLSLVLVLGHSVLLAGKDLGELGIDVDALDVIGLLWTVLLLGLLFSALMMTIATFANSPKSAQAYISPVYMICLVPVIISQIPGIEVSSETVLIPVLNLALVMKQILIHGVDFLNLLLATLSTLLATSVILLVAAKLFQRQDLLISPGGLAVVRGLAKGKRRGLPSIEEALALVGVLLCLLFYVGAGVQSLDIFVGLVVTLFGLVLLPTVVFALLRKHDLRRTFHLRRPPLLALLAGALLGCSAFVWIAQLTQILHETFLPVPEPFVEAMSQAFALPEGPWGIGLALLVFAVSPAICEEALFRGFLLSSFRGRTNGWIAVVVSSLLFGLFHLSLFRLLGTTGLGLLMGFLVWRSLSIWPAVLFHFVNNAAAVLSQSLLPDLGDGDGGLPIWLLAVAGVLTLAGAVCAWFGRGERQVLETSSG